MLLDGVAGKLYKELGFKSLVEAGRDVYILMVARVIRMFAYGASTLILALHLAALGHSDVKIGLFMTLTLLGDVLISLVLTLFADRLGRRRILTLGAGLMTVSGIVFATTDNYWVLLFAAVVGVISPSGNEIGPFRAVEESTIAHLTEATARSNIFALYVVGGTLGASLGSLLAGWLVQGLQSQGWTNVTSFRIVFWVYTTAGVVKALLSLLLSADCEVKPKVVEDDDENAQFLIEEPPAPKKSCWLQLSPASQRTLFALCSIFMVDSLASGMVPSSLIAFYISGKFDIEEGTLGTIIAAAQMVSSFGNMLASSIARRIGLVSTMVFTHLPSAIFLALIPAPTTLWLTIVVLVARSSLSSMDQAPRSAFLSAIVLPDERTATMGVVNTVKTMSQSAGPTLTGLLAGSDHFWIAFVVAGGLKASYDLLMLKMFSGTKLEGENQRA